MFKPEHWPYSRVLNNKRVHLTVSKEDGKFMYHWYLGCNKIKTEIEWQSLYDTKLTPEVAWTLDLHHKPIIEMLIAIDQSNEAPVGTEAVAKVKKPKKVKTCPPASETVAAPTLPSSVAP